MRALAPSCGCHDQCKFLADVLLHACCRGDAKRSTYALMSLWALASDPTAAEKLTTGTRLPPLMLRAATDCAGNGKVWVSALAERVCCVIGAVGSCTARSEQILKWQW
jgi:hypothetical protein